ncbi:MAG: hypothetical protein HYR94_18175 [Chloroflexi bacterium]|nr:hypothetical protein [Chloroflexota bacterium]
MARFNQAQLQRQVEILIANGKLAQAQAIIATIGYNPAGLEAGQSLLQQWLNHKTKAQALLADQKQATIAQEQARRVARAELSNLSQTVRVLFGRDQTVLTSLGLLPRRSSANGVEPALNGNGNGAEPSHGNGYVRRRVSMSLAEIVARWRLLVANMPTLTEVQQAELANAGWSAERIAGASELVDACAAADTAQQQKIQAHRAEAAAAREAEIAMRQWYGQATHLSRLAIKQADPGNREQLRGLLGL